MKHKILYIDDEKNNLFSFKAAFRLQFQIFTASTAQEAVTILMENPDIKVIFCDQRMPNTTGVELLEQLKYLFPAPIRIMITGFADIDAVIGAINKGNIFYYIKKPWNEAEILEITEEAINVYTQSEQLSQKNEELQEAYKELDKFAYSVSHDIRGPIAGMITGIDYLQNIADATEVPSLLEKMKKSLLQLDEYIVGMHNYYNLQKGKLLKEQIDFKCLVEENKNIFSVFALASKIDFETNVVQDEPFVSDTASLKLILNNLLSNAFKYQVPEKQDKKVRLEVLVNKGLATILVEDNGIGMEEQSVKQIFDLHYRISNTHRGFGLGLFNLKTALIRLNGHIDVSSKPQEGSRFKVTIPCMTD